jgi:predicted nucleic acid-binding protein
MLLLDSGAISRLAERSSSAAALIRALRDEGLWPPVVSMVSLVESLTGAAGKDANTNRFLKLCHLVERLPEPVARRAAFLRARARRGSAVDAIVVAMAEPRGTVLTTDAEDLGAIASRSDGVVLETV